MKTFTLNKVKNKAVPVKHFNEKQELLLKHGALFLSWACSLA